MDLDDYTPDNICRAMGMTGFADVPTFPHHSHGLRLLFKPSFHPEVCVTCWPTGEGLSLQIIAFREMLWDEPKWRPMPSVSILATVAAPNYQSLATTFEEAARSLAPSVRHIVIDGMPVAALGISPSGVTILEADSGANESFYRLCLQLFEITWRANTNKVVANALAHVGRYLGLNYPVERLPPTPRPTHLLILGTPEDRAEFFHQLSRAGR